MLKAGTLIDATLVEAAVARPPQSGAEVSTKDLRAGFTRRGQRSIFGFKAHVAVDFGSDLIRDAILTGADVGDSLAADGLAQGDEAAVFMDKAYDSAARHSGAKPDIPVRLVVALTPPHANQAHFAGGSMG